MDYSSSQDSTTFTSYFSGTFGFEDNELVQKLISELTGGEYTLVSIDLSKLDVIDSAGLGMLLLLNDAVVEEGKKMELSKPSGQVLKMLEISKFSEIIPIKI